jgi:hypothetical protein
MVKRRVRSEKPLSGVALCGRRRLVSDHRTRLKITCLHTTKGAFSRRGCLP